MKRKLNLIIITLCVILLSYFSYDIVFAVDNNDYNEYLQQIESEFLEDVQVDDLKENLPDGIKEILSKYGIDDLNRDTLINLSVKDFFKMVFYGIMYKLKEPLSILATLLAVILLASLLNTFENTFNKNSLGQTFQVVSILCVSGFIVTPIIELLRQIVLLIEQIGMFLLSFIPVFTGIITVSGKPLTAFAYNGLLLGTVQIVSIVSKSILIPLCGSYLALVICSSVTNQIDINNFMKTLKTILMWILGFLLTVFVAILTIKSFVASSADTVTMKAGKYVAGSFIPVIGGVISDTLSVLQGSIGVIKSSIGTFGIIVIFISFIPSIVSILLMNISIKLAQIVSDMLAVKKVSGLLNSTSFVLTFMQAILICYGMMVIISIALMLLIGVNT